MRQDKQETKITVVIEPKAGGHIWSIDVNGLLVTTGWHFTEHEAKQEALELGMPIAIRWINPRGVTPLDAEKDDVH